MRAAETQRAVAAAMSIVTALDIVVDGATVLSDSNRLVVRLTPCNIVVRIAPMAHFASADLEVAVARELSGTDSPVAGLDARVEPRVFLRDGFEIAMWTFVDPVPVRALPPAEYAQALVRLHAGLRRIDVDAPHVMDRVAATERAVLRRDDTPDLTDRDRALLADTLRDLRRSFGEWGSPEQLLHGEPHPWNLLDSENGLLFIDFENTACGPVEYDLAWVPDTVVDRYPAVDRERVEECRGLVLAIITTHRWSRDDEHPSGRQSGEAFLDALRRGRPWPALDDVVW